MIGDENLRVRLNCLQSIKLYKPGTDIMILQEKVFTLKCAYHQNAWGKIGPESEVAQLLQVSQDDFELKSDQPYAELWMGTHKLGPSIISNTLHPEKALSWWIQNNPDCLGSKVRAKFNGQLPFLFKVLSVNKTLSLQVHPSKSNAEKLYAHQPDIYPDDNHKPEMVVALTRFEGLNGFRPAQDIIRFFEDVPELRALISEENRASLANTFRGVLHDAFQKSIKDAHQKPVQDALKRCFTELMHTDSEVISRQLAVMVARLQQNHDEKLPDRTKDLILKLNKQYPRDIGCFASFFMNHVILQPGEAMFVDAGEPHAYIDGNCIECMACSHNVIRAGFTSKYKDVPSLCEMLTYTTTTAAEKIFHSYPDPLDSAVTVYNPPVPDFAISQIKLDKETRDHTLRSCDSASIILIIKGQISIMYSLSNNGPVQARRGSVLFVAADIALEIHVESDDGLLAFRAYCPLD